MDAVDTPFWTSGWGAVLRVLLTAPLAYAATVAVLRLSGKRSVAKLSAFDLVVTVALGSSLSSIVLSSSVPLTEGLVGIATLLLLQWLVSFATSRSATVRSIVKSPPRVLAMGGELVEEALAREKLGPDEVHAAVRRHGKGALADVAAVVLESDGTLSVIAELPHGDESLRGVRGWDPRALAARA